MQRRIHKLLTTEIKHIISRNIHIGRCLSETHYDVLKLPRNCSTQEIRHAFIKLSKQYHPDKNIQDENTHTLFVRLNEAYTVLSRPESRREYDLSLLPRRSIPVSSPFETYDANTRKNYHDPSFWQNHDQRNMDPDEPYYGVKGIRKMSNGWIVALCLLFAAFGVGLQVLLIKRSITFSRRNLDKQSQQNAQTYAKVREKALREGNAIMIKRMEVNADHFGKRYKTPSNEKN